GEVDHVFAETQKRATPEGVEQETEKDSKDRGAVNCRANASREFAPPQGARGQGRLRQICLLGGILLAALSASAQLEVGDNWRMNLNGDVGYSYNGNINQGLSGHSMGFTGNANLAGSYYNPNFLNFNVQPYYDRVQSNSVF